MFRKRSKSAPADLNAILRAVHATSVDSIEILNESISAPDFNALLGPVHASFVDSVDTSSESSSAFEPAENDSSYDTSCPLSFDSKSSSHSNRSSPIPQEQTRSFLVDTNLSQESSVLYPHLLRWLQQESSATINATPERRPSSAPPRLG
jgi:hypothetical protein